MTGELGKTFPCPTQQILPLTLVVASKRDWKDTIFAHTPSTPPSAGTSMQRPTRGGSLQKARWFLRGWDHCEGSGEGEKSPVLLSRDLKAVAGGEAEEFHKRKNYSAYNQTTSPLILSDLTAAGLVSTRGTVPSGAQMELLIPHGSRVLFKVLFSDREESALWSRGCYGHIIWSI